MAKLILSRRSAASRYKGSVSASVQWLSGCGDDENAHADNATGRWGTWRGQTMDTATIWTYPTGFTDDTYQIGVDYFVQAGYTGTLILQMGWPTTGSSWATGATGGLDSYFNSIMTTMNSHYTGSSLSRIFLSFAYEFNGNWMPWSVNSSTLANFGATWKRYADIVRNNTSGHDYKIVLPFAAGSGYAGTADAIVAAVGSTYFDILGADFYDAYLPGGDGDGNAESQTEWDAMKNVSQGGVPLGPDAVAAYAATIGKPFLYPEWGLSNRTDLPGVDNPFFITAMNTFFRANAPVNKMSPGAGKLAAESYFNAWADNTRLYPTTSFPNSAAAYNAAVWGS